jgi:hypothetical protein
MKHQVHVATESGIVSTEAVMQIRRLITDLARTVDALDAAKNRPRADAGDLDTRRRNLMVTIASLEDRLDCIEKVRSREYGAPLIGPFLALTSHGFTERVFRFQPRLGRPVPIGRVEPLRHDAFEAHVRSTAGAIPAVLNRKVVCPACTRLHFIDRGDWKTAWN